MDLVNCSLPKCIIHLGSLSLEFLLPSSLLKPETGVKNKVRYHLVHSKLERTSVKFTHFSEKKYVREKSERKRVEKWKKKPSVNPLENSPLRTLCMYLFKLFNFYASAPRLKAPTSGNGFSLRAEDRLKTAHSLLSWK